MPCYQYSNGRYRLAYHLITGSKVERETFVKEKDTRTHAAEVTLKIANGQADLLDLTGADKEGDTLARQFGAEFDVPIHVTMEESATAKRITLHARSKKFSRFSSKLGFTKGMTGFDSRPRLHRHYAFRPKKA